jgi:hypothetical protein
MVEGMTGQQVVITKLSTNGRCYWVEEDVMGRAWTSWRDAKEGTATMHKRSVQRWPKAGNVEKRG